MLQMRLMLAAGFAAALALAMPAVAQKAYGPGASDATIKIGNTMPYSGPASAYGTIGKVEAAYFKMINEQGGVKGRKIEFISLDDGYSPPKTVEQVRKLVEQEEVLLVFQPLGTPSNTAIHQYMNAKKVPQLLVSTGATKWGDPQHFPWTMGFNPSYQAEARIYARHLIAAKPDAKIAVLYQNDDFGKDYLQGLKDGLGDRAAKMLIATASYEPSDPTVDSQIVTLQSSGADTFINVATPKAAAQAIRKAYDSGWRPLQFLSNVSTAVGSVLQPAGLDKSTGVITAAYLKDPGDPEFQNDPAMVEWRAFMAKHYPEGSTADSFNVYGYTVAQVLVQVLKQCGDNLTRENVMKEAAHLDMDVGTLQPGVRVTTSPTDFYPLKQMRLQRFDGKSWVPFGEALEGG